MAAARSVTQRELFQAAQQNDFRAVGDYLQVLLDEAADTEQPKSSGSRSQSPQVAIVKSLFESKTRNTLLHYACDNGNIEACKFLLMHDGMADAFLNEPNAFGHTPLFYAASSGKLSLVKWLISNGADIDMDYSDRDDVAPRDGDFGIFTPLQIACFKGHDDVVNFLVECNASLAGTARNGKTPLHFACSQNHKSIVRILLEAGADAHACDDQGKTPVDVAPATLLPCLLPENYSAGQMNDDDEQFETNNGKADDEEDEEGFGGVISVSMTSIRNAFGADIARLFRHKSWKNRVQAIGDATIVLQNTTSSTKTIAKLFDGGCEMIVMALQDAVSQVVSSSCSGLLKSVFNAAMGGGIKDFHTAKFHHDHPLIKKISDLLLLRGAGSNEKDASEAVASLLFLICKSTDITRYLTSHISGIMQIPPSSAVTNTPLKGSEAGGPNTPSWRLQLVAIKILNTVASQYRLDDTTSGLSFNDAIRISTSALENASVHVRSASIDLLVQCLLIRCEQSDVTGSVESIFDQMKSWSEAIFKQQNLVLKPSFQAKINNGLKNALQQSKRLNGSAATTSPRGDVPNRRGSIKNALPLEMPTPVAGTTSPRSKGAQKEDDLPYAEPIQEQFKEEAAPVLACFGDKLTRCLFSNAWAPRVEALSLLQFQVESKHLQFRDGKAAEHLLLAMQKTLVLALQDRVNSVYEAGVALLTEFAIALNSSVVASPSQRMVAQDIIRPMIPRLLTKLGDTKAKLHVTTEDALLLLSRQEMSLGPEFLVDEMIACDRNVSVQSMSPTYISNKLSIVSKLILEFGVKEANDQSGLLPIKLVLQPALHVFEHRDPTVRQVALQIVGDTVKTARAAAMPFLDALARASRQKIIAKLVEKGVLETDLLMDEVDDFDIAANEPVARPGTSGGIRPPTASGSSTKHRPALSSTSLSSAPVATTSMAMSSQGPALPYGTALTKDQESAHARLIECFGEELVRCLLDKAWAQREAAIREVERLVVCTANGKLPVEKALAKTPDTLRILSQCVELGLNDTVARVFQCTLRLCQLIATEFVPIVQSESEDDIIDSFLEHTAGAALQRFGDTKQRLRADCVTLLHSLASLSHVTQKRMCRILATKFTQSVEASPPSALASSPLVGAELFKLFAVLIRDSYSSQATPANSRPELEQILKLITVAFENKHVDVRNAAIDAYTTIYEVTNGGATASDLNLPEFLSHVKPAIRDAITRKVVQLTKLTLPDGDQGDNRDGHEIDSSRQQPLALDINKLRHVCSKDITELLTSPSAGQRCAGVDKLIAMFTESPRNPQFKGAWEISCLLAKQLLFDGTPGVCLAAFQLLWLIADPPSSSCEYAIPWGEWGVHLILGSTIRSVIQQSANSSVRVRTHVKAILQLVAKKSSAGRNAVCNAVLSAPEQRDLTSEPSKRLRKIALCRLRWQWMLRLELMLELLDDREATASSAAAPTPTLSRRKSSSSGTKTTSDSLSIENVVPFLGSCMVHPSPSVRNASRKIMTAIKNRSPTSTDDIFRFVQQECSPSLQRRLQPLLAGEDDGDDNNTHADHFNTEDTTVVRGSRASHVRRIAALRPPRSVPVEERSLEVDVFPPPHSAPGKSRRSLQADDGEEFGDYVVKPRAPLEKEHHAHTQQLQAPIWLTNVSQKNPDVGLSSKRASDDSPEANYKSYGITVGGGAANLVKVRRKSSIRSNNGDEDEFPSASLRGQRSGY